MDDFCGLCWNGGSITLSMINANIGIKILGLESKYSGSFWNLDQHGSNLYPANQIPVVGSHKKKWTEQMIRNEDFSC